MKGRSRKSGDSNRKTAAMACRFNCHGEREAEAEGFKPRLGLYTVEFSCMSCDFTWRA